MKPFKNRSVVIKILFLVGLPGFAFCLFISHCSPSAPKPAPLPQKSVHFGKDTLVVDYLYCDTIRADSLSLKSSNITFSFADSVKGMSLRDSIFSWTPDTVSSAHVTILACSGSGACDTIKAAFHIKPALQIVKRFHFSKDTLVWHAAFYDTLRAEDIGIPISSSKVPSFRFIDSCPGMTLADSIFSWTPDGIGHLGVSIAVCATNTSRATLIDTFCVLPGPAANPDGCPPYAHKITTLGHLWDLPGGYFVFAYNWDAQIPGLFLSKINKYQPKVIPNTQEDYPQSLGISKDGNWILYITNYKAYLIKRDGSKKVAVPTAFSVDRAAFYRNGPYGDEICYTSAPSKAVIRSVRVTLDSTPVFGVDRLLADVTGKFRIERYYNFAVSRDEILGAFTLLCKDTSRLRMGFLTIPGGGRGVAGPENMYKWKDDDSSQFWGCNSTLSHDGSLALYISGAAGHVAPYDSCIPPEHLGFVVTPFRRDDDPSVGINEHIDRYATSVNWCPSQYRFGTWSEMNFRAWYLGNRNDYVIGCQSGTLAPIKVLWMVDWQRNVWTMLSPMDSLIDVGEGQTAVYFSDSFSVVDDGNPYYRVIYPSGGETLSVGQQCTVKVSSERDGNAGVKISLQNGLYSFMLPSITQAINPRVDSTVIFTIPETFTLKRYNQSKGAIEEIPISTVSDSCRICIQDYTASNGFGDCSNGFFSIRAAKE